MVTIKLSAEDWEAVISAADGGLTDLEPEAYKNAVRVIEDMEDQLEAATA